MVLNPRRHIAGDKHNIEFSPSNYTPDASIAEADDVDDLSAHLKGIDTKLGEAGHDAVTLSGTPNYITLSVQDIVRGLIVLTTDVSGLLPHENGGLEADVSAFTGLLAVSGGATSEVDSKAELEAQIADVADFAEADGDVYTGLADFGGADLELPNAANPTVDSVGEIAVDTTLDVVKFHDGVAERVLGPELSKAWGIENPTATEDGPSWFTNKAITITEIRAVLVGSSTPSVTWTLRHGTDRSATGAEVVTGGTATTSITTGSDVTSFNDATVVADSFIWLETTAKSGTVTMLEITVMYQVDP